VCFREEERDGIGRGCRPGKKRKQGTRFGPADAGRGRGEPFSVVLARGKKDACAFCLFDNESAKDLGLPWKGDSPLNLQGN